MTDFDINKRNDLREDLQRQLIEVYKKDLKKDLKKNGLPKIENVLRFFESDYKVSLMKYRITQNQAITVLKEVIHEYKLTLIH